MSDSNHREAPAAEGNFNLAFFKLLTKHPLYDYRSKVKAGFRLSVLLLGSGEHLDKMRDKILSNGQLLDTELDVMIATENPPEERKRLLDQAPELGRFMNLDIREAPRCQWDLGTLQYKSCNLKQDRVKHLLKQHPHCRYVLISTEDSAKNQQIAKAIPKASNRLIAWLDGNTICTEGTPGETFSPHRDDAFMQELRDIAYRLHYAYSKGNDPHSTTEEILESFKEPYNYESNIECALHIYSKLKCAGINPKLPHTAAEDFAKKLEEDSRNGGTLLDRLAQLEHRRWCISKFLKGFRKGTAEQCYQKSGDTAHSTEGKWHVCLVPYVLDGGFRRLNDQDWSNPNPESITDLDELDMQTLRVHRRCGELAQVNILACIDHARELEETLPEALKVYASRMGEALEQMRTGETGALFLYRKHLEFLNQGLGETIPAGIEALLDKLKRDLAAPIEYLTCKDYKEQNLVLVRQIPFALSHPTIHTLVKLMADQVQDCVSSAWQLEPSHVVFMDVAETMDELLQIRERAHRINYFLSSSCNEITTSYEIFVPASAQQGEEDRLDPNAFGDIHNNHPEFFDGWNCHIHPQNALDTGDIRRSFVELMQQTNAAAIDMTGGKPVLISLADGYARNSRVGAFFIRDNKIRNFYGVRSLDHQLMDKGLSVQELFAQAAAVKIKQDDEIITPVFQNKEQYKALWNTAFTYSEHWNRFCVCFAKAYQAQQKSPDILDKLSLKKEFLDSRIRLEEAQIQPVLNRIARQLDQAGLLKLAGDPARYTASCPEVLSALRNSGKALEYYIYCSAKTSVHFKDVAMSWMFRHSDAKDSAKNELDVICTTGTASLFISAKHVKAESFGKKNFLNYVCYEVGWLADRFGGINPKMVLAAPNLPQFNDKHALSDPVKQALSRGVYLLGRECFQGDHLLQVLHNIAQDDPHWCDFLTNQGANA